MSENLGTLTEKLELDGRDFQQGISHAQKSLGAFATAAQGFMMGVGMAAAQMALNSARAMVTFGGDSVKAASDLNETMNMTTVVMGKSAEAVLEWSKGSATALGMSRNLALTGAGTFATFGKSAGLAGADLTKFSTSLVGLATDMASFRNTSPEEAITAIGAALRGESEPIRRYGVLLDDASLRQQAFSMGITASIKNVLTPQQRVLAATALIFAQTSDAQGDFARTSGALAGQQKILTANMVEVQATVGAAMLPAMTAMTTAANTLVAGVLPSLAAVIGQVLTPAMNSAAVAVTGFGTKLSAALAMIAAGGDPVGSLVEAFQMEGIAEALNVQIAGIEQFVNDMQTAFDALTLGWQNMVNDVKPWIDALALNVKTGFEAMIGDLKRFRDYAAIPIGFGTSSDADMAAMMGKPYTPPYSGAQDVPRGSFGGWQSFGSQEPAGRTPFSLGRIATSGGAGRGGANTNVMGDYGYAANKAAAEALVKGGTDGGQALVKGAEGAGKALGDTLASALSKVPGLMGTSSVTAGDMARGAAGLPNDFADTWRRRVEDELKNGVDWADVDPASVAASVGLDPSVPAAIIIDELNKQWASGEYFANTDNLARIDWEAVQKKLDTDARAALGQKNIVAGALAQGITLESMTPVATQTASAAAEAFNSPAGAAALQGAGEAAFHWVYDGFGTAAAGTKWWNTIPVPTTGPTGPGTGVPFAGATGGTLQQQPGVGASGAGAPISITINGVSSNLRAVGSAASNGVLSALRARGTI